MAIYTKRLTAPDKGNKYYISASKGGYSKALIINKETGETLPNCVGYVHGRFMELQGVKVTTLATTNAETLWGNTKDGYARGKTPKLGAILCQRRGVVGNSADGAGHVSIVEEIKENGDIVVSQSHYGGVRFDTRTYKKGSYNWGELIFQGFIYPKLTYTEQVKKSYGGNYPKPTLKLNSTGTQVTYLQKFLKWAVGYNGKINGVFGPITESYVKKYQKARGLKDDGIVGKITTADFKKFKK